MKDKINLTEEQERMWKKLSEPYEPFFGYADYGYGPVAIGSNAYTSGELSIAIGISSKSSNNENIAIGDNSESK